ncbi:protein EMSY-LIKE 1 isoform X1 [Punica granatum]|uniref:Protein EMSY-LIKE 1 isoform X1 n=1 Tax=Punica granatum TaxID=22663 RepID=A0A6P8CCG7_PUNGR|nr:protein EMSY-LIKE 1 isoform X1 [Punica granatum]
MEAQIHSLEQEAYASVLRAFKAQSDAITWEKESLITELRKELRVSDDEHRELLSRVNADETIRRIREWRQAGGHQTAILSTSQPIHDLLPSPTVSGSRKKQKTSQLVQHLPSLSSVKPIQYPPSGPANSRQYNRSASAIITTNTSAEADPLIGKRVWTRWPDDNSFYEAVITDYNPVEGRHALVYDIHTANETWEWVDLKEISPEDIRWDEDPSISNRRGRGGPAPKKSSARSGGPPSSGRARVPTKSQPRKENLPLQNGALKKLPDDIELFNTDSLVKEVCVLNMLHIDTKHEYVAYTHIIYRDSMFLCWNGQVERVFDASNPNLMEIAKAKKMLKEHEQALIDAIARLGDASDGESDGGLGYAGGQLMEQL